MKSAYWCTILAICFLFTMGFTATASAEASDLVITEIMYDPDSPEPAWEYVEIYNKGNTPVDLAGFVFDDIAGAALSSANIASGTVPAGATAVLFNGSSLSISDFQAAWGNSVNAVAVSPWPQLNNSGTEQIGLWETLASYDSRNLANAIDSVLYGTTTPWPSASTLNGSSIFIASGENNFGTNWARSTAGNSDGAYQSTAAGSNTGLDIGSPGVAPTAVSLTDLSAEIPYPTPSALSGMVLIAASAVALSLHRKKPL